MVRVGTGLVGDKTQDYLALLAGSWIPGEEPVLIAVCNNFRPFCDRVVVTNRRVLGFTTSRALAVAYDHTSITTWGFDAERRTFHVEAPKGRSMTFKAVPVADHDEIDKAMRRFAPQHPSPGPTDPYEIPAPAAARAEVTAGPPAAAASADGPAHPGFGAAVPSISEEVTRLAELRDAGVLSEHEFTLAKRRVITGA
ncbi:hypothetical protein CLV28_2760 [Sediminihabitans luteus]|uniref:Uncharacterized protein n=1 Tax=Sediminihabitans luteus TaxID=1138585 RepID=A0A2M9CD29_9CELL|nr:SHOCT domain-containing protein [Sediminihabitans luteus]PJJ69295.1 hypothetical protein CLV28_2760 [Sediminihabitans luteus]GII98977.1 hypothetical protein Slu03_13550 [Sediminihabitans luteus]